MITYEELKRVNACIVAEALKDMGIRDLRQERLDRIASVCEDGIRKNDALKGRLVRDRDYQMRCHAIDARSLPLREILKIARGD